MASDYPTILQIVPIPATSTKLQHIRAQGVVTTLAELSFDNLICTHPHSKEIFNAETLRTKSSKNNIRTHNDLKKIAFSSNLKLLFLSMKAFSKSSPIAIHAYGFRGLAISAIIKTCFFWKQTTLICDLSEEESLKLNSISRFHAKGLLIKLAEVVLCQSEEALDATQKSLKLDSTKTSLVVNGINSSTAFSDQQIVKIRTKLKLDENRITIVVNGDLEKKNEALAELQKVILAIKESDYNVHFLIIGEPKKYLYSFLKKNDCRSTCSFLGHVNAKLLPQYYSVCDIALTLSRNRTDDHRATILNFMANSLPVIALESKLHSHLLPEGTTLSLSTADIIRDIKYLCDNQQWRSSLATKNVQRFDKQYSWDVSKEQLHASYLQALS